jgi:hypothetical protein
MNEYGAIIVWWICLRDERKERECEHSSSVIAFMFNNKKNKIKIILKLYTVYMYIGS